MALVSLSFTFFRALEITLDAVKNGDARLSVFLLKSISQDGSLLKQLTTLLRDKLNEAEKEHQQKGEILTRDMNEFYRQEEDLKKKKAELETTKHLMTKERELCSRKKEDAWRRYQEAQKEMKEAESKMKEFHDYWWVPVYSWEFLVGMCRPVYQILTRFQTHKNVIFHTRFQAWPSGRNYVIIT